METKIEILKREMWAMLGTGNCSISVWLKAGHTKEDLIDALDALVDATKKEREDKLIATVMEESD